MILACRGRSSCGTLRGRGVQPLARSSASMAFSWGTVQRAALSIPVTPWSRER
nr:MAG TPA_asm: hypothetical protein [Caudoviricetes sp.]